MYQQKEVGGAPSLWLAIAQPAHSPHSDIIEYFQPHSNSKLATYLNHMIEKSWVALNTHELGRHVAFTQQTYSCLNTRNHFEIAMAAEVQLAQRSHYWTNVKRPGYKVNKNWTAWQLKNYWVIHDNRDVATSFIAKFKENHAEDAMVEISVYDVAMTV